MQDSEEALLEITGSIYDTLERPESWPAVLDRLAGLLRATAGTLNLYNLRSRHGEIAASCGIDPEFPRAYGKHFAAKDLWMTSPFVDKAVDRVVLGQELIPDERLARSEFHEDFLRPQGIFHLIGSRVQNRGDSLAALSLFRSRANDPFGRREIALLQYFLPHVRRVSRIHFQLSSAERIGKSLLDVLDEFAFGIVLVSSLGKPWAINRCAGEIASARDGLVLRAGRVEASSPRETAQLLRWIASASTTCTSVRAHPGGTLRLSRPSGKPPLVVLVAPLSPMRSLFGEEAGGAVLFITDPATRMEQSTEVATALFGLTNAEGMLCRILMDGRSLEEASHELGVSLNTVRTHLKRIFEKTGAHRQAELVLLLTKGIPSLRKG